MSFAAMRAQSVKHLIKPKDEGAEKKQQEKEGSKSAGEKPAEEKPAGDKKEGDKPPEKKVDPAALVRRFQIVAGVKLNKKETVPEIAKTFRKQKVREFWIYIFFVIVFSASTLQQRPVEKTHDFIKQSMDGAVLGSALPSATFEKTLDDVGSIGDFWEWITEGPPQYLYQYEWYNGTEYAPDFQGTRWRVLQNNVIVQKPRLRQLRVLSEQCEVPRRLSTVDFGELLSEGGSNGTNFFVRDGVGICFPYYADGEIDTTGFRGVELIDGQVVQVEVPYRTAEELNSKSFTSRGSATPILYEGGGYVQDFPLNATNEQFTEMLLALKGMRWTDRQTRAILFDWTIYNIELNTFLSSRITFEFQPHGFVVIFPSLRAFKVGYVRGNDVVLLVLDMTVYALVFINIFNTFKKVYKLRLAFFTYFWNAVDLLNYIFFLVTLYFKIEFFRETDTFARSEPDTQNPGEVLVDFEYVGWLYTQISSWNGFNSLITWMKLFSFLRFMNPSAEQLIETIAKAGINLALFAALFSLVLWAYAQAMYVSFGTDMYEFKAIFDAYVNTFKALLAGFDFEELRSSNVYLGPLIYISFQFIAFFVMLNMFLAIIAKTYDDVTSKNEDDPMAIEFRHGVSDGVKSFLKLVGVKRDFKFLQPKAFPPHLAPLFHPEQKPKDGKEGEGKGDGDGKEKGEEPHGDGAGGGGVQRLGFDGKPAASKQSKDRDASALWKLPGKTKGKEAGGEEGGQGGMAGYNIKKAAAAIQQQQPPPPQGHHHGHGAANGGHGGGPPVKVYVPEEVMTSLLSSVRELSLSIRHLGDRLDDLGEIGLASADRIRAAAKPLPRTHRSPPRSRPRSPLREVPAGRATHGDPIEVLGDMEVEDGAVTPTTQILAATADMLAAVAAKTAAAPTARPPYADPAGGSLPGFLPFDAPPAHQWADYPATVVANPQLRPGEGRNPTTAGGVSFRLPGDEERVFERPGGAGGDAGLADPEVTPRMAAPIGSSRPMTSSDLR